MKVAIGSDHAGYEMKEEIRSFIESLGHEVIDVGTFGTEAVDYPDFAEAAGIKLISDAAERAVVICGSGLGASIAANKIPGVRAGNCMDTYSAHQGVEHDDMNMLVFGARVVGIEVAKELVTAFLNAKFTGEERHVRRLGKVKAIETKYSKVKA